MERSCSFARPYGRIASQLFALCCLLILAAGKLAAQSTFGTILGSVHDSSGALVAGAQVTLTNTGTAQQRQATTGASGDFYFNNIDVGRYRITVAAAGFEKSSLPETLLTARETRRMDVTLKPGAETQTVVVNEAASPVVNTEVSNLAETKVGEELVDLPVAIYSRSTGSTSPFSTLTTEAGVQTDDSGNLAVMGTTSALLSVTIDGISSVGVEMSGPLNEMFPSFNSIEEIRVSESNNNAEFSGVADITTISKAGTNQFHGGVFENHENTALNSGVSLAFAPTKPKVILNDFGGTLGGPLTIPHLYEGRNKTFFFISYEGLRLPRETPLVLSVPSNNMRSGNLTSYLNGQGVSAICMPSYAASQAATPACGPSSALADPSNVFQYNTDAQSLQTVKNILQYLYPAPNYGDLDNDYANNYHENFRAPISANQGDVRIDHTISPKQNVFARFSYKNRQVITAPSPNCVYTYCAEAGSPLQGGWNTPEIDEGLTFAHNYIFSSNLLNEFRGGFNAQHTSETQQSYTTSGILGDTGLYNAVYNFANAIDSWPEAPEVAINGFMATGAGNPGVQRGKVIQLLDNVTWNHGAHAFKFGVDFKRISDHDDNVYGNYRAGWYVFDSESALTQTIGDPYAAFLLGYPDYTEVSATNKPTMNGVGHAYAFFVQDNWKVTPRLTLNLGVRYELHPPIRETDSNSATFMPDYNNGAGAVVVPDAQALTYTSSDFASAISPTPIITAATAGIPSALRYTDKSDWGPRIGFAWRPFNNDKTVIRGGWGRFLETPMGFSLYTGWAVHASYLATYNQDFVSAGSDTPLLSLSNPFNSSAASGSGTANFDYAYPIHYKDPSVQQWNLTWEQDLGHSVGVRLSYTGSHGSDLDAMVDLNQVPANSAGYDAVSANRPYTSFAVVQSVANASFSNYHSGTVELSRHGGKGVTFDASYTFTRDLSNAGGATPNAFAVAGGSFLTDRFHPGLDYGNVVYDRRHRFLATYLYDLPFGKNRRWLSTGKTLNLFVGGWQLAGVTVLQSGPFLTPYEQTTDPAGTNILTTVGQTRADITRGKDIYPAHRTTDQWLARPCDVSADCDANSAFSTPENNRGYFGTAGVGSVVGPGTQIFSFSLKKTIDFTEKSRLELGLEAANAFNHRNYEPPNMQVDSSSFGSITALQTAEGAGPRSLELTGRISF